MKGGVQRRDRRKMEVNGENVSITDLALQYLMLQVTDKGCKRRGPV